MALARKRFTTAAFGLSALTAVALVPVTPAQAEPNIKDVRAKVDRLYHQAEEAQERFHDANLDLAELRKDATGLKSDQKSQQQRLDAIRAQVSDAVVRQMQGKQISTVGRVVVADDPGVFLGTLSTMSSFGELQESLLDDYRTELDALEIRQEATEERTAQIAELAEQLDKEQRSVDAKLAEAKAILADLEAEERDRLLASRAGVTRLPSDVPASGRAAAAVRYALAQVGDAYVYGAAGENAFDCSGLTMRAWAQAGVGLPHSSSAQFGSGPRIATSDLQPGDLVFYYSPISHVGMYIGSGMIVHAANPGTGVVVSGLHSMPYVGAVRPG